jgi:xanthine/CO dehydrogenase XdhC/CoxF family maturation factor
MSLRERREIAQLCRETGREGAGVLFSLVRVSGSSYRRPGARLLTLPDGRSAGTISGGCLEADLRRRAQWRVRDGASVERFTTTFDDTAEIPYGLGCGGEVDLLAEAADAPEGVALLEALAATLRGEFRLIATVLPEAGVPLSRIVVDTQGDVLFASDALETERVVDVRRAALSASHGSVVETAFGSMFVERLDPIQRLLIFGAAEGSRSLCRMAAGMGWSVVVADGRSQMVRPELFPEAEHVAVVNTIRDLPVQRGDAAVLMTHSYEQDRSFLAELLHADLRYLGVLGARHRSALLLQEAAEMAGVSLATAVERTHAPIGLNVGGDGPEAVALSVMAELQRAITGQTGAAEARAMGLDDVERLLRDGPVPFLRHEICAMDLPATATADVVRG